MIFCCAVLRPAVRVVGVRKRKTIRPNRRNWQHRRKAIRVGSVEKLTEKVSLPSGILKLKGIPLGISQITMEDVQSSKTIWHIWAIDSFGPQSVETQIVMGERVLIARLETPPNRVPHLRVCLDSDGDVLSISMMLEFSSDGRCAAGKLGPYFLTFSPAFRQHEIKFPKFVEGMVHAGWISADGATSMAILISFAA